MRKMADMWLLQGKCNGWNILATNFIFIYCFYMYIYIYNKDALFVIVEYIVGFTTTYAISAYHH
jgi:hypothetical protein